MAAAWSMKASTFFGPSDTLSLFTAASSSLSSRRQVGSLRRQLCCLSLSSSNSPFNASFRYHAFRNQISFPQRHLFCRAKPDGSPSLRVVPPNELVAEKEEAKAVLALFLRKQGMSNAVAARTVNRSDLFIDHLTERLHSVYKTRYLVGRELTTHEIRDALIPYLDTLLDEYGDFFVDMVENFPDGSVKEVSEELVQKPPVSVLETSTAAIASPESAVNTKKQRALARVNDISPTSNLPPHIIYLVELGMELKAIKEIIRKFPAFAYYSLDGKIKPIVEFLLSLGIPESDIPTIISKRPQLCGISLSENLIPTMTFLETLGVDKKQWAKVISRFPALLTYSRPKLQSTVDFLYETGLSAENVSKILTRCPSIISYSVEEKLRPTACYFESLGIDVAGLLARSPQTFGLSVEANLKPVTEFFLERGYGVDDIRTMVTRYGALYTFSLSGNLAPKWDYFLTMGYPMTDLIKFPQYFGYSLEERIKPRHAVAKESGVKLLLNQVLSLTDQEFDRVVRLKMKKMNASSLDA